MSEGKQQTRVHAFTHLAIFLLVVNGGGAALSLIFMESSGYFDKLITPLWFFIIGLWCLGMAHLAHFQGKSMKRVEERFIASGFFALVGALFLPMMLSAVEAITDASALIKAISGVAGQ